MNNIMYDKETKRVTGMLDFDWSCISHPAEEFLTGLWDVGGGIGERVGKLLPNVISGDFDKSPDDASAEDTKAWEVAKAWDAALVESGAAKPSTIAGIRQVQALGELEQMLCPFDLSSDVMLKRRSEEDNARRLAETGTRISEWLKMHSPPA